VPDPAATPWLARGAWAGILAPGRHGRLAGEPGLRAAAREGLGLATIIGSREDNEALARRISDVLGIDVPTTPRVSTGREAALVWAGPAQWLLVAEGRDLLSRIVGGLAGFAAVSDQSDARALIRFSGPRVRDVLAKGCPIDLHPRRFGPGDAAVTSIAHMGVQLWQIEDTPSYDLAVARSMAASFWSWFHVSAAEHGYEIPDRVG
jgi:heterotetrameric sarcosine oxidase gamma subunit